MQMVLCHYIFLLFLLFNWNPQSRKELPKNFKMDLEYYQNHLKVPLEMYNFELVLR